MIYYTPTADGYKFEVSGDGTNLAIGRMRITSDVISIPARDEGRTELEVPFTENWCISFGVPGVELMQSAGIAIINGGTGTLMTYTNSSTPFFNRITALTGAAGSVNEIYPAQARFNVYAAANWPEGLVMSWGGSEFKENSSKSVSLGLGGTSSIELSATELPVPEPTPKTISFEGYASGADSWPDGAVCALNFEELDPKRVILVTQDGAAGSVELTDDNTQCRVQMMGLPESPPSNVTITTGSTWPHELSLDVTTASGTYTFDTAGQVYTGEYPAGTDIGYQLLPTVTPDPIEYPTLTLNENWPEDTDLTVTGDTINEILNIPGQTVTVTEDLNAQATNPPVVTPRFTLNNTWGEPYPVALTISDTDTGVDRLLNTPGEYADLTGSNYSLASNVTVPQDPPFEVELTAGTGWNTNVSVEFTHAQGTSVLSAPGNSLTLGEQHGTNILAEATITRYPQITVNGNDVTVYVNGIETVLPIDSYEIKEDTVIMANGKTYYAHFNSLGGASLAKDGTQLTDGNGAFITMTPIEADTFFDVDGRHTINITAGNVISVSINGTVISTDENVTYSYISNRMETNVGVEGWPASEVHIHGMYVDSALFDGAYVEVSEDGELALDFTTGRNQAVYHVEIAGTQPRPYGITFNDNGSTTISLNGMEVQNGETIFVQNDSFVSALPDPIPIHIEYPDGTIVKIDGVAYQEGDTTVSINKPTEIQFISGRCLLTINYAQSSYTMSLPQEIVYITAPQRDGWRFDHWSSEDIGIGNPRLVKTMLDLRNISNAIVTSHYEQWPMRVSPYPYN